MSIERDLQEIAEINEQIIRNLTREGLMLHHLEIERETRKMDFESKWGGEREYMPQDFTFEDYLLVLLNFQSYGIFGLRHFFEFLTKEELVEKLGHDFKGE